MWERVPYKQMTRIQLQQAELTCVVDFVKPAFSFTDTPGRVFDFLIEALGEFGSTSNDLQFEEGEPEERGVICLVDSLDATVTVRGDRLEIEFSKFASTNAGEADGLLEKLKSGLTTLIVGQRLGMHSLTFDLHSEILDSAYKATLERLVPRPRVLPAATESAIIYFLPEEPEKGYGESSVLFSRSDVIERGLQVSAILTYNGDVLKSTVISAAWYRLLQLLRSLEFEYVED